MTMPNFLIIGAAKSGTSSLHHFLSQHPQIFMSPMKEPKFFTYENCPLPKFRGLDEDNMTIRRAPIRRRDHTKYSFPISKLTEYQKLFIKAKPGNAIGESSPDYMYCPQAIERIRHHIPHAKLIAILRNPVDRAFSHYKEHRKKGFEQIEDFSQALEMEPIRIQREWMPGWHYKQRGFYYKQLKRYFDRFDKDQIRVYLYESFCSNQLEVIQDIFRFLGVDDTFKPDLSKRKNVSGGLIYGPKNIALDHFLNNPFFIKRIIKEIFPLNLLRRVKVILENINIGSEYEFVVPPMQEDVRKRLQKEYKEDILKLQDLIGQDLSRWLA
jgi:hypothetical protein